MLPVRAAKSVVSFQFGRPARSSNAPNPRFQPLASAPLKAKHSATSRRLSAPLRPLLGPLKRRLTPAAVPAQNPPSCRPRNVAAPQFDGADYGTYQQLIPPNPAWSRIVPFQIIGDTGHSHGRNLSPSALRTLKVFEEGASRHGCLRGKNRPPLQKTLLTDSKGSALGGDRGHRCRRHRKPRNGGSAPWPCSLRPNPAP